MRTCFYWIAIPLAIACSDVKMNDSAASPEVATDNTQTGSTQAESDTAALSDENVDEEEEEPEPDAPEEPVPGFVVLNELVSNAGDTADWFELYNPGDTPLVLTGWAATDQYGADGDAPWEFDAGVTVPPKGWLLVYADNGEGDETNGLHATFKLSKDGETVTLLDADGAVVDAVTLPELSDDESYARTVDGGSIWAIVPEGTPGAANAF